MPIVQPSQPPQNLTHPEQAHFFKTQAVCNSLIRTLCAKPHLHWSRGLLFLGDQPIELHAPYHAQMPNDLLNQRGLTDGAALKILFSDHALHLQHQPHNAIACLFYELFEQLRVDQLAPSHLPGVSHNVKVCFYNWAQRFLDSGLIETHLGMLIYTVSLMVYARLGNTSPAPHGWDNPVESLRAQLAPQMGHHLVKLKESCHQQAIFITHSLALSQWLVENFIGESNSASLIATNNAFKSRNGFMLTIPSGASFENHQPQIQEENNKTLPIVEQSYHIWTTAFDKTQRPAQSVRLPQLLQFRDQMDETIHRLNLNLPRLIRLFRHSLALPRDPFWLFEQDLGRLDGRRLMQLVSNPLNTHIFKLEQPQNITECALTILLDCSGSMKNHAEKTSVLLDVLGKSLYFAGVSLEILGFSTNSWDGGRAKRDWQRKGSPTCPGRLNEVLHLIFKAPHDNWKTARLGISAIRKLDLYREGIDGEALQWACSRLLGQNARRRILLVISDGCPMDTATHLANGAYYLENHLKKTIQSQKTNSCALNRPIEICALGLGLALDRFYQHSLHLPTDFEIDHDLLLNIAQWLVVKK